MKAVNKVTLLGNVGNTEFRNGVLTFSMATSEPGFTKKDGSKIEEKTQWHRCVCFGKLAETMSKYINKGDKLYLEGRITYSEYEKEGQKHSSTNIVVNDISLITTKSTTQQASINQPQTKPVEFTNEDIEDLPF